MNPYGLIIPCALLVTLVVVAFARRGAGGVGEGLVETGKLLLRVAPNLGRRRAILSVVR